MLVNSREFIQWKELQVTEQFLKFVQEYIERLKHEEVNTDVLDPMFQIKVSKIRGIRKGLEEIINMTYDDLNSIEDDEND